MISKVSTRSELADLDPQEAAVAEVLAVLVKDFSMFD
jgi:hypothetical protein